MKSFFLRMCFVACGCAQLGKLWAKGACSTASIPAGIGVCKCIATLRWQPDLFSSGTDERHALQDGAVLAARDLQQISESCKWLKTFTWYGAMNLDLWGIYRTSLKEYGVIETTATFTIIYPICATNVFQAEKCRQVVSPLKIPSLIINAWWM